MVMRRTFGWVLCLLALSLGASRASGQGSPAERYLFDAANAERQQRGLTPLVWDEALHQAARKHAAEMASREEISHQFPGEAGLGQRVQAAGARFTVIAENVAEAEDERTIHTAWMESPGHRANLLNARLTSIGISVVEHNGDLYAVQDFDKTVQSLSFDAQENAVGQLLTAISPLRMDPASTEAARTTCGMSTGFAGRQPRFLMRFTTGELNRVPDQLKSMLATGKYHEAAVGACSLPVSGQGFSAYSIAVLLYP